MNTRLQVEHGVTEEVTGIDLVASQVRLAWGDRLDAVLPEHIALQGHAIEARIYAEDPVRFFPSPGPLRTFRVPSGEGLRFETGYAEGNDVTPHYDPMIGKLIARGRSRSDAIERLGRRSRKRSSKASRPTSPSCAKCLASPEFIAGDVHTGLGAQVLARAKAAVAPASAASSAAGTAAVN